MKKLIFTLIIAVLGVTACKKTHDEVAQEEEGKIIPANYLTADKYKNLTIDLVHDAGYPPSQEMIANLKEFLGTRLNKPEGIKVIVREISGAIKESIRLVEVADVEKKYRKHYSEGTNLAAFVYISGSKYAQGSGNGEVLGLQYASSGIALFGKSLKEFSGGLGQPTYAILESTVAEHEFCHLMGLVNNGTPLTSAHQDSQHGQHCNNTNCLMHYQAETSNMAGNLLGGEIPQLDGNCINDLRNNGGK